MLRVRVCTLFYLQTATPSRRRLGPVAYDGKMLGWATGNVRICHRMSSGGRGADIVIARGVRVQSAIDEIHCPNLYLTYVYLQEKSSGGIFA